jgi:hypothetical protein
MAGFLDVMRKELMRCDGRTATLAVRDRGGI